MPVTKLKIIITLVSLLCLSVTACAKTQWQQLKPGLAYTILFPNKLYPWGRLHAFRINLNHYQLELAMAADHKTRASTVRELAQHHNAPLAVNGGFFSPKHKPLGLRINNGVKRSPLKNISWWGVFYTQGKHAYVVSPKHFTGSKHIAFAVQGGPRLLIAGRIPHLKAGLAERTALGITPKGDVIITVTEKSPMSTTDLAKLMKRSESNNGLNCTNALNLDGGSSSQLYANIADLKLNILGFASITDAVMVVSRSH